MKKGGYNKDVKLKSCLTTVLTQGQQRRSVRQKRCDTKKGAQIITKYAMTYCLLSSQIHRLLRSDSLVIGLLKILSRDFTRTVLICPFLSGYTSRMRPKVQRERVGLHQPVIRYRPFVCSAVTETTFGSGSDWEETLLSTVAKIDQPGIVPGPSGDERNSPFGQMDVVASWGSLLTAGDDWVLKVRYLWGPR